MKRILLNRRRLMQLFGLLLTMMVVMGVGCTSIPLVPAMLLQVEPM